MPKLYQTPANSQCPLDDFSLSYISIMYYYVDTLPDLFQRDNMKLKMLQCLRCLHQWVARVESPAVCPHCHSPYWNRPRQTKTKI